jgi:hypothetical protein
VSGARRLVSDPSRPLGDGGEIAGLDQFVRLKTRERARTDRCRERSGCCQYCCQAAGQRLTRTYSSGMLAQRTARNGRPWTMRLLLRIRRFPTLGLALQWP